MFSIITPQQWLGVAIVIGLIAWKCIQIWGLPRIALPRFGITTTTAAPDNASLDFAAVRRLKTRMKTPEQKAALKVVALAILDDEGDASA